MVERVHQAARSGSDRWILAVLALAMVVASTLILYAGRGTGFTGDELTYFGRVIERGGEYQSSGSLGLEYLLAPHNGHLQLVGKLIYESVFATAGADYGVLRVLALLGVLACAGLVFVFIRGRVGALPALVGAILLLFLGAAWEVLIWPFDLHTSYSFAFGLAALLVLDRGDRFADSFACALLVLSLATIEVGLALLVAAAIVVVAGGRGLRRAWVFAVPLALYAGWWAWAGRFEQGDDLKLSNLGALPSSIAESLSATFGSLAGRIEAGPGVFPQTVGLNAWGWTLAAAGVLALAMTVRRRGGSPWLWALLAGLIVYWSSIGLADRAPDSSRYIFVGAGILLLVFAEAMRGLRASRLAGVVLVALVAASLPLNITKLFDGRTFQVADAQANRARFAIAELHAAERPNDPLLERWGSGEYGLAPVAYFDFARRFGPFAYSLEELRSAPRGARAAADASLSRLLGLRLVPAASGAKGSNCRTTVDAPASFDLPPGGVLLEAVAPNPALGLSRFVPETPSVQLGGLSDGRYELRIPADSLSGPWRGFTTGALRICGL